MARYAEGDRVVLLYDSPDGNDSLLTGATGMVVYDGARESSWVDVCWDNQVAGGHDCNGRCEDGYGWSVERSYIKLFPEVEIPEESVAEVSELYSFLGICR